MLLLAWFSARACNKTSSEKLLLRLQLRSLSFFTKGDNSICYIAILQFLAQLSTCPDSIRARCTVTDHLSSIRPSWSTGPFGRLSEQK